MYRVRRPLGLMRIRRAGQLRALKALGRAATPKERVAGSPKIAVVELIGSPLAGACASALAHAMRLRGCEVMMYTCGGGQPLCPVGWSRHRHPLPCDRCAPYARDVAHAGKFPLSELGDYLPWGSDGRLAPSSIPNTDSAISHRKTSHISAAQWFRSSDYMSLPGGPQVVQDLTVSAAGVEAAIGACLERDRPDIVLIRNGYYTAEHTILQTARAMDIHVVSHECVYSDKSRFFSHNSPAVLLDTDDAWQSVRGQQLNPVEDVALDELLTEREGGQGTYSGCFTDPVRGSTAIRDYLGIPDGARLVVLLPNITWDTATINRDAAFSSIFEWIDIVIDAVKGIGQTFLVVRSHPQEAIWRSRERMVDIIEAKLGGHPGVRLVAPDEPVDTYSLIDASDLVLTYTSIVGLEAAMRGKPVAVAGDVHYRGKGFTIDVRSGAELAAMIGNVTPAPVDAVRLARAYCYMFFFRMMIPLPGFELAPGVEVWAKNTVHRIPRASELMPGANPYLDFVCDKIITREPFLLPRDLALAAARAP